MFLELPLPWVITFNVLGWPLIQLSLAWLGTKLPGHLFAPDSLAARPWGWERDGRIYEQWFAVQKWKDKLPDGGALFGGNFSKKHLTGRSQPELQSFLCETVRGEIVHWLALLATPVFFIFNPPWACWLMVGYAIAANLPCIIAQRYNRLRVASILIRKTKRPETISGQMPR
jgi:glycosyl-4,4'-diaponeurosporenoate acyltransferase